MVDPGKGFLIGFVVGIGACAMIGSSILDVVYHRHPQLFPAFLHTTSTLGAIMFLVVAAYVYGVSTKQ
jgi:hypothetical protein